MPTAAHQPATRIGLVGLDTSHAQVFTAFLNDPASAERFPGCTVVAAYPGGSDDFELSRARVGPYTAELRDKWNVAICNTPEAVAEASDLVFITTVDGRLHRAQFERTAPFRRPTFIDKPLATSPEDAAAIIQLAEDNGITLTSASALRYCDSIVNAIGQRERVVGCDVFGPMAEQPTQPGLYWYGIHCVDMAVAAMGVGCVMVNALRNDRNDLVQLLWADGRMASIRGLREAHGRFGITVHTGDAAYFGDHTAAGRSMYAALLHTVIHSLTGSVPTVPTSEMFEVIRIIDAINRSRSSQKPVELRELQPA